MSGSRPGSTTAGSHRSRGRSLLRHALRLLPAAILVAAVVVGAVLVWRERAEVTAALAAIGPWRAVLALLLSAAGVVCTAIMWRVWLGGFVPHAPVVGSGQVFFVTQAGKYLPGTVWPFVAQAAIARRVGLPRSGMVGATLLFFVTNVSTGAIVGIVAAGPSVAQDREWLLYPAALVSLVPLVPAFQRWLLSLARRLGRDIGRPEALTWGRTGRALAAVLGAWVFFGLGSYVLAEPLGAGPSSLLLVVGAFAFSWTVGFLMVAAPAGAGVREAVMIAVLTPVVGFGDALSVALLSRMAIVLSDVGLAAMSFRVVAREVRATHGEAPADVGAGPAPADTEAPDAEAARPALPSALRVRRRRQSLVRQ